ncbi:riboflavin biosynthesis protein RibD [mine drainage metagenome]|uniref:Riboflavin biosynthesis protein RibD n=1 Tax=mine drainage metagenome TaxID=410659 RepID=A0A1J5SB94_9ZZZZ
MTHADYLKKAFLLSTKAKAKRIRPNPFVGALIVNEEGVIIGKGYHKKLGGPHAEVYAIEDALSKYNDLSKCTIYVTLEPCSHFGKTPPCTDLIIKHKIKHVVIGSLDPNPLVSGAQILIDNGVTVDEVFLPEIRSLNETFFINTTKQRPKFQLKIASTLNGKIADRFGNSKWLTNEKSRAFVHSVLRQNADAILSTAHTIIKDNAGLNIRSHNKQPIELNAIIIDRKLNLLKEVHSTSAIFYPRTRSKIYLVTDDETAHTNKDSVEIIHVNFHNNKADLLALSKILFLKGIFQVLVEAGGKLNSSLIEANLIDELFLFITPKIINDQNAIDAFNIDKEQTMDQIINMELQKVEEFDQDILLHYKNII